MPSADQVPVNCTHSTMRWPKWVVLIAGSTGSALRAVRSSQQFTSRRMPDAICSRCERDGFLVALVLGHHRPGHSRDLVGECDGSDLGRPPRQQCRKPWSMFSAVELGIADHGERTGREQAAQIAVSLLADAAELVFTPA